MLFRMPPLAANPVYANVAFLLVSEFAARSVIAQASLKDALEGHLRQAIAAIPAADRVVLDADDGVALVLFGDPAHALDLVQALHLRGEARLQVGLSFGPLALTARGKDSRVFGDGLSAAAAAAHFASPEKLLVTQDFANALAASSPARAAELAPAGEFTDTKVRLHSFFTPDPQRGQLRRRRMVLYAIAGVAAILLLGLVARKAQQWAFPPRPALVRLEVKPRGEVFVDGVSRGKIPPLKELEISPGQHRLQIRQSGYPPLELSLELKAGESMTITHTFGKGETKPDYWRDFRRKFGF